MKKNTSIALGDYFNQFVKGQLKEGRYKNTSEVIRAGLRLLEAEEQELIALRKANQIEGGGLVTDNSSIYQSLSTQDSMEIRSKDTKLTKKELNARINQSESDFKNGKFKSSSELASKYS
jgi:putative addiction module CopG family antidote